MSKFVRGGGAVSSALFHHVVSVSNLLSAWNEFRGGKRKKRDVGEFEFHLEDHIFRLHRELVSKTYVHDPYRDFFVADPKRRHIHKASVRDRVLHQAVFRGLYQMFDKDFIYDSYSSRNKKGTHAGVARLTRACRKATANWRKPAYVLKCDVRKFFDSIDHKVLRELLVRKISDTDLLWLIDIILASFEKEKGSGKGLPLGNVTSQLFANVYLNELDQFVKHALKAKYYFRYCDDFVLVHFDKNFLENALEKIGVFLTERLLLELHPNKVEIRKIRQGVDFLGYVVLPHATVIRTSTRRRVFRKIGEVKEQFEREEISKEKLENITVSYLGVLSHCRSGGLRSKIKRYFI